MGARSCRKGTPQRTAAWRHRSQRERVRAQSAPGRGRHRCAQEHAGDRWDRGTAVAGAALADVTVSRTATGAAALVVSIALLAVKVLAARATVRGGITGGECGIPPGVAVPTEELVAARRSQA